MTDIKEQDINNSEVYVHEGVKVVYITFVITFWKLNRFHVTIN